MSNKRYSLICCGMDGCHASMQPRISGEYALHTDYAALEAENARLTERCAKLESAGDNLQSVVMELRGMLETQEPERLYQAFEPHYGTLAELINDWLAVR